MTKKSTSRKTRDHLHAVASAAPEMPETPAPDAPLALDIPETLRWKLAAHQEKVERIAERVRTGLLAELQQKLNGTLNASPEFVSVRQERDAVLAEIQEALKSQVPEGYQLSNLNTVDGKATLAKV